MITIKVPATSANIGLGFDTLGMALTMYSTFTFEESEELKFIGFDDNFNNENNLVYTSFVKTLNILNKNVPRVTICFNSEIPISRGLGSSATCVVAGVFGAFLISNTEIDKNKILQIASEIEGHPDNVAPAIFGNLICSCEINKSIHIKNIDVDEKFNFIAIIPKYKISTNDARSVMPKVISISDAINNLSKLPFLLNCFENYNTKNLKNILNDKIHEPYRKNLIKDYDFIKNTCESIDSLGFFISGSGSTLINILENKNNFNKINNILKNDFELKLLKIDKVGTIYYVR